MVTRLGVSSLLAFVLLAYLAPVYELASQEIDAEEYTAREIEHLMAGGR